MMIIDRWTATRAALKHMTRSGFRGARRSPGSSGGAAHLVTPGVVAAVNHSDRLTRSGDIRRLTAIAGGRIALSYSAAGFARRAVRVADRAGVALFQLDGLGDVQPRNRVAVRLVEQRRRSGTRAVRARLMDGPPDRPADPVAAPSVDRSAPGRLRSGWAGVGRLVLAVSALLAVIVVGIELFELVTGVDLSIHEERTINSTRYRDAGLTWPFRMDSGDLACRDPGYTVTFTVDEIVYVVSDGSEEDRIRPHWFPATEILADGMGPADLGDVLHDGRTLCHLD